MSISQQGLPLLDHFVGTGEQGVGSVSFGNVRLPCNSSNELLRWRVVPVQYYNVRCFASHSEGAQALRAMQWFRSRLSLGSWLALFALTVQLVLSFGHVHLDGGASLVGHSSTLLRVHASSSVDVASLPAGDEAPAGADEYCAVCALIHLAGTVVMAQPPSLPLPAVFGKTPKPTAGLDLAAHHHSLFAARAPPVA